MLSVMNCSVNSPENEKSRQSIQMVGPNCWLAVYKGSVPALGYWWDGWDLFVYLEPAVSSWLAGLPKDWREWGGGPLARCPHQISTRADKRLDFPSSRHRRPFLVLTFSPCTLTFYPRWCKKCVVPRLLSGPVARHQREPLHTSCVVIPASILNDVQP